MSKHLRAAIVGVVAVLSLFGLASAASALTVSPAGAYRATATGSTLLSFTSNRQVLTCTSSSLSATIASDGRGTIPAGSALYGGCTNSLLGSFTVTQNSDWAIEVVLSGSIQLALKVTVPARGVTIRGGGCSFTVNGEVVVGKTFAGPLPITITTADVFGPISSRLTTDSVSGCSPLLTTVGLGSTYSGSYRLDRGATVSG